MHIVHVAAEMAPFAKVGGLGDAVLGLAKESAKDHSVSVIMPKYSLIPTEELSLHLAMQFSAEKQRIAYDVRVFETKLEKISVYFIETSPLLDYFYEGSVYLGDRRDTKRFIYFCKVVAEYLIRKNQEIDVLHLHDWHTSLMAPLVKEVYLSLKVLVKSVVISIHNLAYTGPCTSLDFDEVHYPMQHLSYFKEKRFFSEYCTLLRGALALSDAVVAVSKGYAEEILTKKYASGFLPLLQKRKESIFGITNGIDLSIWNPATDPYISHHFSKKDSFAEIVSAKKKNKEELQKRLGLQVEDVPLFIAVARLVEQKNPQLLEKGIWQAKKLGAQGILLGTAPKMRVQKHFEKLSKKYAKDPSIRFIPLYDEALSHMLYAAGDFFLMPSNFEPCGLTQLIALIYGCLPIVHEVGGLRDTVFDARKEKDLKKANGFSFAKPQFSQMKQAMQAAIDRKKKDGCKTLIENAVEKDYSWKEPKAHYEELYQSLF